MDPKRRQKKQKVITDGRRGRFEFAVKKKRIFKAAFRGCFFLTLRAGRVEKGSPTILGTEVPGPREGRGKIYIDLEFGRQLLNHPSPEGRWDLLRWGAPKCSQRIDEKQCSSENAKCMRRASTTSAQEILYARERKWTH